MNGEQLGQQQYQQQQPKKNKFKLLFWLLSPAGLAAILGYLTNFHSILDEGSKIINKIPYTFKIEHKTETHTAGADKNKTNEGSINKTTALSDGSNEGNTDKTTVLPDGINPEELLKSTKRYNYRIRAITYTAKNPQAYQEKYDLAIGYRDKINNIIKSHTYDEYMDTYFKDTVEGEISERASVVEDPDKGHIYVYVSENNGTIADMVRVEKTLDSKYKKMFESESGWLGSNNTWSGLMVDYSDNNDMINLSPKDLLAMENLLYETK
ncbi:hypothetical protein [Neobacillus cucumis]|uniref:hypothetical protein n=1 Tax=Neobacillus cucumis TaxID=1740721 RepID=UPI002852FF36|nr:hypothetical protein [Neobacillus cucumis]MDR4948114.1 hypothetical protein [Neobacillus cucumis]